MAKPSRWRRWAMQGLLAFGVYLALTFWRGRDALPTDGSTLAPVFTLPRAVGGQASLSELAGKTVLLHFWATWCSVCRVEISTLNALYATLGPDQVLLTVVADDDAGAVRAFMREHGLRYPVLLGTREVLAAYGVSAFPTNYVIDTSGRVSSHTVGISSELGLRARLGCAR
jgi:peroxiredoxin